LWQREGIVPFLKVDTGLAAKDGKVRPMKPIPGLDGTCAKAVGLGIFGTKMRSVILGHDAEGIDAIVAQQFEVGRRIVAGGLVPILEPEVDIHAPDKAEAEAHLLQCLMAHLDTLTDETVMLKLTLPEQDDLYRPCIEHPRVARVVALSGGYSRDEANARLARQRGMIASFSRALAQGLSAQQSDADFHATMDASIQSIYEASLT
jgi:fructose-bisphosphate aldolase class I